MAALAPEIEVMENRYMRAWVRGDLPELKALTARGFQLLVGTTPPAMLDRASWLEAAVGRYSCRSCRFGEAYVRSIGKSVLFASRVELEASLDGHDWSGLFWVTDLWRKGRIRRRWQLAQRILSRVECDKKIPGAIKAMQLWR